MSLGVPSRGDDGEGSSKLQSYVASGHTASTTIDLEIDENVEDAVSERIHGLLVVREVNEEQDLGEIDGAAPLVDLGPQLCRAADLDPLETGVFSSGGGLRLLSRSSV